MDWRGPIKKYLEGGRVASYKERARRLKIQVARFCMIEGQLFKRSLGGPYMRCLGPEEAKQVLKEMHEGMQETILVGLA